MGCYPPWQLSPCTPTPCSTLGTDTTMSVKWICSAGPRPRTSSVGSGPGDRDSSMLAPTIGHAGDGGACGRRLTGGYVRVRSQRRMCV